RAVLGRPPIGCDERAVGPRDQMVLPEFGDLFENGISGLAQKVLVASEGVMFPIMLRVPGGAGRIPFEATGAEDVVFGLHGPSADAGVVLASGFRADRAQAIDVIEEWDRALGEVGDLRRPVVHLDIDVGVVVAAPWRIVGVVPKALQIGRETAGAGG